MAAIFQQLFPPKAKWAVTDIPDLSGKVALVTGGNTGIGKETCRQLLRKNAKVYLAARSQGKAQEAIAELEQETGQRAIFVQLDLSDLDSVSRAAAAFLKCVARYIMCPGSACANGRAARSNASIFSSRTPA